jgi:hypothetical protein
MDGVGVGLGVGVSQEVEIHPVIKNRKISQYDRFLIKVFSISSFLLIGDYHPKAI